MNPCLDPPEVLKRLPVLNPRGGRVGEARVDKALVDETARLGALRRYAILDTPPEDEFDALARLAAQVCAAPVAAISFIDGTRQWFKAGVQWPVQEFERDAVLCARVLQRADLLVISDLLAADGLATNPLTAHDPTLRLYAAAPLVTPDGMVLGSLSVLDRVPRMLTAAQEEGLRSLARQVMAVLELRRKTAELKAADEECQCLQDELRLGRELMQAVSDTDTVQTALAAILRAIAETAHWQLAQAWVPDGSGSYLECAPAWFASADDLRPFRHASEAQRFAMGNGLPGRAWFTHKPVCIADVTTDHNFARASAARAVGLHGAAAVPVLKGDEVVAILEFFSAGPDIGHSHWVEAISVVATWLGPTLRRRRDGEALLQSEARLRYMTENSRDAIYQLRYHKSSYDYMSPSIKDLTGYEPAEINAMGFKHLIVEMEGDYVSTQVDPEAQQRVRAAGHYEANYLIRTKAGEERWLEDRSVAWRDEQGRLLGWIGALRDITERKRAERQIHDQHHQLVEANTRLAALATLDGLTGLKNHRAFQERLEEEFHRAVRHNLPLSLLILDVDRFKQFNDRFGHLAGDEVLRIVARIIRENVREIDFAARYGGEEFVVVLPNTGSQWAVNLAERLRHALETEPWPQRPITASFGASTLTLQTPGAPAFIAQADRALYHSKANGRNRVTHVADIVAKPVP